MKLNQRRIGDVLQFDRSPVDIDPGENYRQIGVRGFGRGFVDYGELPAESLSKLRYYKLGADRLVVSNIKGWEGAVAITDADEAGRIASNRFLQYRSSGEVDLAYARHWLLSDPGLRALGHASPGSADRNRTLSRDGFEAIHLPLPDLIDQRRIAAHLDSIQSSQEGIVVRQGQSHLRADRLPRILGDLFRGRDLNGVPLGSCVEVVNDTIHPGDDSRGADMFVGLEHVQANLGRRIGERPVHNETGRKFRFEPGDITYGYLRPYQNKVWCADITGLCSIEQFVLRPAAGVNGDAVAHILRSDIVLDPVNASTNSLQLPRLKVNTLLGLSIPDVRMMSVDLLVRARRLTDIFVEADHLEHRRTYALHALLPAARNEVFSALL